MLALLAARVARSGGGATIAESAGVCAWSAAGSGSAATATAAAAARSPPPPSPLFASAAAARSLSSSSAPASSEESTSTSTSTQSSAPYPWPPHLPKNLDTPAAREELARRDAERRAALERRAQRPWRQYIEELVRYNRARASWRREMAVLRNQWMAEHRAAVKDRAARHEAARLEASRLRAARDEAEREGKKEAALARELRAAERAVAAAERQLASAQRDAIRGNVLAHYRAQRREAVLEASRSWVPPEELGQRVRAALERPARL
jgi:hypothetical protein